MQKTQLVFKYTEFPYISDDRYMQPYLDALIPEQYLFL